MAYILKGHPGKGPFPHKAGECCGAWGPNRASQPDWFDPTRHRLGRPRPNHPDETVNQLELNGWRGIYLLADISPTAGLCRGDGPVEEVETPDCLKEPLPVQL
jgi:hypothetical protein